MVKKSKAKPAPQLPEGWMCITKYRKKGASKGKCDRTYLSPEMRSFRSLKAVKRFLIDNAYSAGEAFIAANAAEEKDDNLIVEQKNEVINIAVISVASSAEGLANNSSNVVYVVDSSSSDDESDDELMCM